MYKEINQNYLQHHGVKGQKWGVRRYQNPDGTLTDAGKKKAQKEARKEVQREKQRDLSENVKKYKSEGFKVDTRYDEQGRMKVGLIDYKGRVMTEQQAYEVVQRAQAETVTRLLAGAAGITIGVALVKKSLSMP